MYKHRVWTSNGHRYIGFLGQSRVLAYDKEHLSQHQQRQQQDPAASVRAGEEALPFDINEGPQRPLKTMSAIRRLHEQRRSGFNCPLAFDNSRWKKTDHTSVATTDQSQLSEGVLHSAPLEKNKFFEALLKPSVSYDTQFITMKKCWAVSVARLLLTLRECRPMFTKYVTQLCYVVFIKYVTQLRCMNE